MPLCSKCGQRPAIIHITVVVNGEPTTSDYCAECSPVPLPALSEHQFSDFTTRPPELVASFSAFFPEGEMFAFVQACIAQAVSVVGVRQHVTPQQLLAVAPAVAQRLFGKDARDRLSEMGITSSASFGNVVFGFIERGHLSKTETDQIEDFAGPSPLDTFLRHDA